MKKMKHMKKTLSIALAVVLLTVPSLSFADGTSQKKTDVQDRLTEKVNVFKANFEEKKGQLGEKKEGYREKMSLVIQASAPDLLDTFQEFWTLHDAVHVQLVTEHGRLASAQKDESVAFYETIKAQVTSGAITREAAKVQLQAYRAQVKTERETVKAALDALKVDMAIPEGVVKGLHNALKAAVIADDEDAIPSILEDMIALQPQHLAFDQAKLALLTAQ